MRSILSISVTLAIFLVSFTNVSGQPINANIALTKRLLPVIEQVGGIVSTLPLKAVPGISDLTTLSQPQTQGPSQGQQTQGKNQIQQGNFGQTQNPK